MKGPKDSKESHTSVTMEGTAGVGSGGADFCVRGTCSGELPSPLCAPGAGGDARVGAL